ncbi:kinase-like domain-containing protein [Daldinia sp. FL1419]|nr:kinase-like domain-containing protein [Daldinia sp. FL1419]
MASLADTPFADWPTIPYTELVILNQLTPKVYVAHLSNNPKTRLLVKFVSGDMTEKSIWKEMNILKEHQLHPSLLPVNHVILDDNSCIIGMTTKFIPGGSLKDNNNRTFKLKWLTQLTEALDFLHTEQGIVHGDLHLGNILIDEANDRLVLCNLGTAKEATERNLVEEFWSVMWTLYELITLDFEAEEEQVQNSYRETGVYSLDTRSIEDLPKWPVRTQLDCDAEKLRGYLQEWIKVRVNTLHFIKAKTPDVTINFGGEEKLQWTSPIHGRGGAQSRTVRMNHQSE